MYVDPDLYKELYSICKMKMGNKNLRKWDNYITEIKPEYYDKLKEYIAIENNGENKSCKAFRLKKNGQNTDSFKKIDGGNMQIDGNGSQINIHSQNEENNIESD